MRRLALGLSAAALIAAAPGAMRPVAFVGCRSDGQTGPQPAPAATATPRLPTALAPRLSWYATADAGVLAPRGWRCSGTFGSDGATIVVSPARRGGDRRIAGDAVARTIDYGGTSGRFTVADAAAGLFPAAARGFVARVADEGIAPVTPVRFGPADRIVSRTGRSILFETAAGRAGLGTRGLFALSAHAIVGSIGLTTATDEPDLVTTLARLPDADRGLAHAIVAAGGPRPLG